MIIYYFQALEYRSAVVAGMLFGGQYSLLILLSIVLKGNLIFFHLFYSEHRRSSEKKHREKEKEQLKRKEKQKEEKVVPYQRVTKYNE